MAQIGRRLSTEKTAALVDGASLPWSVRHPKSAALMIATTFVICVALLVG
jgi:hypothetical protein